MATIIEVSDSEDEIETMDMAAFNTIPLDAIFAATTNAQQINNNETLRQPQSTSNVLPPIINQIPTTSSNNNDIDNKLNKIESSKEYTNNKRESNLQTLCASPNIQYETINLDDYDDDDDDGEDNNDIIPTTIKDMKFEKKQVQPTKRKLSANRQKVKRTYRDVVDAAFENFLNSDMVTSMIADIAENRVRINYLLAVNSVPNIDFPVFSDENLLNFQLENRLKRQILSQSGSQMVAKPKLSQKQHAQYIKKTDISNASNTSNITEKDHIYYRNN